MKSQQIFVKSDILRVFF